MQIEYQSDVGRRRNTNQDYASVFTSRSGLKLAVLADGMGGHRAWRHCQSDGGNESRRSLGKTRSC